MIEPLTSLEACLKFISNFFKSNPLPLTYSVKSFVDEEEPLAIKSSYNWNPIFSPHISVPKFGTSSLQSSIDSFTIVTCST